MLLPISADAWKDKDGVLTAGEIVAYVKGEHQFDLAEEAGASKRGKSRGPLRSYAYCLIASG